MKFRLLIFLLISLLSCILVNRVSSQSFNFLLNRSCAHGTFDKNNLKQGQWFCTRINDTTKIFAIANFKNDTADGDYYRFYSNGKLDVWENYKMGRIWNTYAQFDSSGNLFTGTKVINGNGIYNGYHPSDSNWRNNPSIAIYFPCHKVWEQKIIKNGLIVKTTYFDRNGYITEDHDVVQDSTKIIRMVKYYFKRERDSIYTISEPVNHGLTRYFVKYNIVVSQVMYDKGKLIDSPKLEPNQFYIPEERLNEENKIILEKFKAEVIRLKSYCSYPDVIKSIEKELHVNN